MFCAMCPEGSTQSGSNSGPDIDLTFAYNLVADGSGHFGFDFAVGGAVPPALDLAMMLVGFAGFGFAGYRASRKSVAVTVVSASTSVAPAMFGAPVVTEISLPSLQA